EVVTTAAQPETAQKKHTSGHAAQPQAVEPESQPRQEQHAQAAPSSRTTRSTSAAHASADPCARAGLAGSGHVCSDHLSNGHRGPRLVVVPGQGGSAYAM